MSSNDVLVTVIFVCTIVAMVTMGSLTRSIGGAFIGLALVCLGAGVFLLNAVDWVSKLLGVVGLLGGVGSLSLAFILGLNMSHSSMERHDVDGNIWKADQTTIGEGAKKSNHDWQSPRQLPRGGDSTKQLGD